MATPPPCTLQPSAPPGHAKRRARGFASEIDRLRLDGYTIEAIRQALHDAGVTVSWATVQREAKRAEQRRAMLAHHPSPALTMPSPSERPAGGPTPADVPGLRPSAGSQASGPEFAQTFVAARVTHPLLRKGPST